jgi:hypothetical protein
LLILKDLLSQQPPGARVHTHATTSTTTHGERLAASLHDTPILGTRRISVNALVRAWLFKIQMESIENLLPSFLIESLTQVHNLL